MQLEAGKKYTDRRGRVYGPLVKCGVKFFGENKDTSIWDADGTISNVDLDMDLVAEYVEPVKAAEPVPVESPDDWVTQDRVPARVGVDEEYWSNWRQGAWSAVSAGQMSYSRKMSHGDVDRIGDKLSLRCRRKDLPPIESPDDWVILDLKQYADHKLRKGVDQYLYRNEWQTINGYDGVTIAGFKLKDTDKIRCRRKDLPPVPLQKPVEPEFPQYYVAGGREHWGYTSYVKRTAVDRYESYDMNGKVDIKNARWTSSTDNFVRRGDWCKVTQAEAEARVKKTRTVVLKEWLVGEECGYVGCIWASEDPSKESDNLVCWGWATETGNTRTVEIPVT